MEVAAFRGVSLGVSMAPWLLLVPGAAWGALGGTQILFTAWLGALWHHEALGLRRWCA
jgi:hypothetical protein